MTDVENSDDERYANESFEKEFDTDVPEMSEFESETTENSDDDDDENLPSVKANTGPIRVNRVSSNYISINKTDAVPFASSSDEEDEVVVGQTMAEINTPSMLFEENSITSVSRLISREGENKESSAEIDEEEDEEEEEFKKIKLMEEKYSEDMREMQEEYIESPDERQPLSTDEETQQEDYDEVSQSDTDSDGNNENEAATAAEEEQFLDSDDDENASLEEYHGEVIPSICEYEASCSPECQKDSKHRETQETLDQAKLVQAIQNSLTTLKIASAGDNEDCRCSSALSQETKMQQTIAAAASNIIDADKIALAVVSALKCAGFNNLSQHQIPVEEHEPNNQQTDNSTNECEKKAKSLEQNECEKVHYKADFEEEKEVECEKNHSSHQEDNDKDICYDANFDYCITSKTPTSFNSDDYIFHANLIKTFYRTDSLDKLRAKPYPRKSMSFSNERMREIERHNQILLRKILTQKPTYNLKSRPSQSSLQKLPPQTNARLTTSALNRKKQQRQIDLDNQVLKRKIEAIALRRRPFIT